MRTIIVWCCLLAVLIELCMSDMYMHFPPGSNNRLNGNQDNVRNANRLFDSQVGLCHTPILIHGAVNLQQAQHSRPQQEGDKICFVLFRQLAIFEFQFKLLCSACWAQKQFGHSNKIVIHQLPTCFRITEKLDTMLETNWTLTLETIFKSSDSSHW